MPLATLPLIAWGTADDISAYTAVGTPTEATGVTDPFGGTSAYTIGDDAAGAAEGEYKTVTFTRDNLNDFIVCAKVGTATTSHIVVYDATAADTRATVSLAWSGGVPTATISAGGNNVVTGAVSLGVGGWYAILFSVDYIIAANTNRLYLYGATTTAAATGTTSYYIRNMVLLDYVDSAVASSMLRSGSQVGQTASGVEDAYVAGRDYVLNGQARWIPLGPKASPVITSGWRGANESTGVNCGVHAMLYAGMGKNLLRWVANRAECSVAVSDVLYNDCYLQRPETDADISLEDSGERTFPLRLRSTSPFVGV